MRKFVTAVIIILHTVSLCAQDTTLFKYFPGTRSKDFGVPTFKIGDTIPDLVIRNLYYSDRPVLTSGDLKGKWLILDFWGYGCSSCMPALAKASVLQEKFKESVKFVALNILIDINKESSKEFHKFWRENKYTKTINNIAVSLDTTWHKRFLKGGVPFIVWIDPDRVVRAMTGSYHVNEKEIAKAVAGNMSTDWEDYSMIFYYYRTGRPPLVKSNAAIFGDNSLPDMHSSFFRYLPQYRDESGTDTMQNSIRYFAVNRDVIDLYYWSLHQYSLPNVFYENNLENATTRYKRDRDRPMGEYTEYWGRKYHYCYELVVPKNRTAKEVRDYMIADFNRYFQLNGRFEPRRVNSWVLQRIDGAKTIKQAGAAYRTFSDVHHLFEFLGRERALNTDSRSIPFINEVSDENNSPVFFPDRLELSVRSMTISELNTYLKPNGLQIIEAERIIDKFVLTE